MRAAAKLRRVLPFLTLILFAALLYDGWVFYSRWAASRDVERKRAEKQEAEYRKTKELLSGLKILDFYASPPVLRAGAAGKLCYSVIGAKRVRMMPEVDGVYPAFSRCVAVSPRQDTSYTLVAEDEAGHSVSKNVAVRVMR